MTAQRRIVVIGAAGQLGQRIMPVLDACESFKVVGVDLPDVDITNADRTMAFLRELNPAWVINCAAMTNVDGCESDRDRAMMINADAVTTLASGCQQTDAVLVQLSTDFVFSGDIQRPYREDDEVHPECVYAQTKWVGEENARAYRKHLVVRTAWLYGSSSGNFVTAILDRARSNKPLRVVSDEVGSPSYAGDVADGIRRLIIADARGTFHLANSGQTSRFELARRAIVLAGLSAIVEPVTSAEYGAAAPRPSYSALDCTKYERLTGHQLRSWESALKEFVGGLCF